MDGLADLDELGGAGGGVGLQVTALGPVIGVIVVGHVAEEEALAGAVDDEADVRADANRPEAAVLGFVELMELEAGVGGIELEIEGGGFDRFLFVVGEAGEGVGEGVRDEEGHERASPLGSLLFFEEKTKQILLGDFRLAGDLP